MDIVTKLENGYTILQSENVDQISELQTVAVTYITFLLEQCQERGTFNLEQATNIKTIIDRMRNGEEKNVPLQQQKEDLGYLFQCIEVANEKGKINLKEAHLAYMSIQSFIFQKNDTTPV